MTTVLKNPIDRQLDARVRRKVLVNFSIIVTLCVVVCSSCVHIPRPQDSSPHQESLVDDFTLLDQNGISHQLYYYSDQKAVVLIAQGNGCPIIRQSVQDLNKIREKYSTHGVVILMVNANGQDDHASIVQEAADYNIQIPILEDHTQLISRSLGLMRTAEAVVIDPRGWKIVYQGPVDDRLNYETQKEKTDNHYLSDVLDQLLDGKDVVPTKISAKGCLIGFQSNGKDQAITYIHDVAPILEKSCLPCHSPGGVAPWSMDDYTKVKGWGRMIGEVVRSKRMPPWQADPHYGKFTNDISLTDQETRTLARWVERGFVRGEGADPLLTAPRPKFKEWTLGKPDVVSFLSKEQKIPSTGVDRIRSSRRINR